jgi:hypothetical protein
MSTFGDANTTGSASDINAYGYYVQYQMGAVGGSCTSMSWYLNASSSINVKFALYADSGSTTPSTALATKTGVIPSGTAWLTLTWDSPVAVTGSALYWLSIRAEAASYAYYGALTPNAGRVVVTYAAFPGASPTFNTTYTTRSYHAYCTYTETASGLSVPVGMNQLRQQGIS